VVLQLSATAQLMMMREETAAVRFAERNFFAYEFDY
jgi:hypothetical protein